MKTIKIIFASITFCLLFTFSAEAQIIDSLPWFKAPGKFEPTKIIDWNSTYVFQSMRSAVSTTKSVNINNKSISLPTTIKVIKTPVIIKRGKNCYELSCARTKACSNCTMVWKDVNRDRKIQPRKELRCVCAKSGDQCKITAKRVECR